MTKEKSPKDKFTLGILDKKKTAMMNESEVLPEVQDNHQLANQEANGRLSATRCIPALYHT